MSNQKQDLSKERQETYEERHYWKKAAISFITGAIFSALAFGSMDYFKSYNEKPEQETHQTDNGLVKQLD